jgi:hypothetical protein
VKYLVPFLIVAAVYGAFELFYALRNRAMRLLAQRLSFGYVGPPIQKWRWHVTGPIVQRPVPRWVSNLTLSGLSNPNLSKQGITRIWNVIEGTKDGVPILIFDVLLGEHRNSHMCTLIACQTEQNPFQDVAFMDRVFQGHGWTVLHGPWFLWLSKTMRVSRIEKHIRNLRRR